MSNAGRVDIGEQITIKRALANTAATAAGAGDATEVTGVIIDRAALGWPQSCVACIPWLTTLTASATLSIAAVLEHGDASNLSDTADFATRAAAVVATGAVTGGGGEVEWSIDLRGAKRYVRLMATPDLSAAGTDTAAISGVIAFGGAERLPQ